MQLLQGETRGSLFRLFLGVTGRRHTFPTAHYRPHFEKRTVIVIDRTPVETPCNIHMIMLRPLDQLRFEIGIGMDNFIQVDVGLKNFLYDKTPAALVASIEIYRPDKGFKGISVNIIVVRHRTQLGIHNLVKPYFCGDPIERFALSRSLSVLLPSETLAAERCVSACS